jgi:uncharacterized coiled-coil protein SlyX
MKMNFMNNRSIILGLSGLACFALFRIAQAVVPAPDGGYPGFNTAEGQNALFGLTTGVWNTALGAFTLSSDTTGNGNTAVGINVLRNNVTGAFNTGVGLNALFANNGDPTVGAASQNSAFGTYALFHNTTGSGNSGFGSGALTFNTTGYDNVATGLQALEHNINGIGNTATGTYALLNNNAGSNNTASGIAALINNTAGNFNTANGVQALFSNTTGTNNTAIGTNALVNNTIGSNNIAVGFGAGSNIHTASDTICIGAAGVDATDGCYIGHVFEESLDPDNLAMAIDVHGKVGTVPSSQRFKDDIKPMEKASEAILELKPVTFHYKNDAKHTPRFGLIAEEVANAEPNLVARDKEGKPYSVRYDQVNAMLLNEFLKEHKRVDGQNCKLDQQERTIREQEATIAELKCIAAKQEKGMAALAARVKEQDSKIQKVSAQIEMSKPAPKVVVTEP